MRLANLKDKYTDLPDEGHHNSFVPLLPNELMEKTLNGSLSQQNITMNP